MTDERYQQLIALTKPPHNIDVYQVLMQAVQEATLRERVACANIVDTLVLEHKDTDVVSAYKNYAKSILERSGL